jgi:hypothetical protein
MRASLIGASLTTDIPGIFVRNILTTPMSSTATFQISFAARIGATAVTVKYNGLITSTPTAVSHYL